MIEFTSALEFTFSSQHVMVKYPKKRVEKEKYKKIKKLKKLKKGLALSKKM